MPIMKASPSPVPEIDRLFDRLFDPHRWPHPAPRATADMHWEPALDIAENPREYVVRLDIPGVARDDLDVAMHGSMLTLSGRRELNKREKGEDYLWEERVEGRFTRTLRLPAPVQEGKIEATYSDGILTVKLPKLEPAMRNKIAIK